MHVFEVAAGVVLTVSVAGASYAALNVDELTERSRTVADQATCRALDSAVIAYSIDHDAGPRTVADLAPYLRGDVSAYRIVDGLPAGPGCG